MNLLYSSILFAVLFIATAFVHKPFNAHETQNKFLKGAHYWLEIAVVIQGLIVINLSMIKF